MQHNYYSSMTHNQNNQQKQIQRNGINQSQNIMELENMNGSSINNPQKPILGSLICPQLEDITNFCGFTESQFQEDLSSLFSGFNKNQPENRNIDSALGQNFRNDTESVEVRDLDLQYNSHRLMYISETQKRLAEQKQEFLKSDLMPQESIQQFPNLTNYQDQQQQNSGSSDQNKSEIMKKTQSQSSLYHLRTLFDSQINQEFYDYDIQSQEGLDEFQAVCNQDQLKQQFQQEFNEYQQDDICSVNTIDNLKANQLDHDNDDEDLSYSFNHDEEESQVVFESIQKGQEHLYESSPDVIKQSQNVQDSQAFMHSPGQDYNLQNFLISDQPEIGLRQSTSQASQDYHVNNQSQEQPNIIDEVQEKNDESIESLSNPYLLTSMKPNDFKTDKNKTSLLEDQNTLELNFDLIDDMDKDDCIEMLGNNFSQSKHEDEDQEMDQNVYEQHRNFLKIQEEFQVISNQLEKHYQRDLEIIQEVRNDHITQSFSHMTSDLNQKEHSQEIRNLQNAIDQQDISNEQEESNDSQNIQDYTLQENEDIKMLQIDDDLDCTEFKVSNYNTVEIQNQSHQKQENIQNSHVQSNNELQSSKKSSMIQNFIEIERVEDRMIDDVLIHKAQTQNQDQLPQVKLPKSLQINKFDEAQVQIIEDEAINLEINTLVKLNQLNTHRQTTQNANSKKTFDLNSQSNSLHQSKKKSVQLSAIKSPVRQSLNLKSPLQHYKQSILSSCHKDKISSYGELRGRNQTSTQLLDFQKGNTLQDKKSPSKTMKESSQQQFKTLSEFPTNTLRRVYITIDSKGKKVLENCPINKFKTKMFEDAQTSKSSQIKSGKEISQKMKNQINMRQSRNLEESKSTEKQSNPLSRMKSGDRIKKLDSLKSTLTFDYQSYKPILLKNQESIKSNSYAQQQPNSNKKQIIIQSIAKKEASSRNCQHIQSSRNKNFYSSSIFSGL